jgi:type III secretory pathway lipoprotein EscJ
MTEAITHKVCRLNGCSSLTLQKENISSVWSRRWMQRYCSKEHWKLAKKFAWQRVIDYGTKFILITGWLLWKIIYYTGIALFAIIYVIGSVKFAFIVIDAIEDILNPSKRHSC